MKAVFLDRDGTINREVKRDVVRDVELIAISVEESHGASPFPFGQAI